MIWTLVGLQDDKRDVGKVCAVGFLVYRALVEAGVFGSGGVDGIHVHYWHSREQHFGVRLGQSAVALVPAGSIKVQTVDVHTLL